MVETPVRWNNAAGSKVSLWHGLQSFTDLLRIRRHIFRLDAQTSCSLAWPRR